VSGPLRTLASDGELALLKGALDALWAHAPRAYERLFDGSGRWLPPPPGKVADPLRAFGLVEQQQGGEVRGTKRVRALGMHHYVLELGMEATSEGASEYRQERWPETDALLERLAAPPWVVAQAPGRQAIVDLGTGAGIVAIEAAARGHRVVATDLYEPTLLLAQFNARLNGQAHRIEFRQGHLWEPLDGERCAWVLSNIHYGRLDDQLRVELLRGVEGRLCSGGRLDLATQLEWGRGRRLGLEGLLQALARQGHRIVASPILSEGLRSWSWELDEQASDAVGELGSRGRFVVEVLRCEEGPGEVSVQWPGGAPWPRRTVVPLGRLRRVGPGAWGHLGSSEDVAALEALLVQLEQPSPRLELPLEGLWDSCRLGSAPCVADRGAAGALVRAAPGWERGAVRPCSDGDIVGSTEDTVDSLRTALERRAELAASVRGCATCSAAPVCSRCLFPGPLGDDYCRFIRRWAATLPRLARLWALLSRLAQRQVPPGLLSIERWPRPLAQRSVEEPPWSVARAGTTCIVWGRPEALRVESVSPVVALVGGALARGRTARSDLEQRGLGSYGPAQVRAALAELSTLGLLSPPHAG
jgi:SAM-dependent methyltransferase